MSDCLLFYLPVDEDGRRALEAIMEQNHNAGVRPLVRTPYDRGLEEGRQAMFEVVEALLNPKFGPLPETVVERLKGASLRRLQDLALRSRTATSLAELGLVDS